MPSDATKKKSFAKINSTIFQVMPNNATTFINKFKYLSLKNESEI